MRRARIGGSVAAGVLLGATALAKLPLRLPFLHHDGGAKIQTWVFFRADDLDLAAGQIGVFEFPVPQHTAPAPPRFGELLYHGCSPLTL